MFRRTVYFSICFTSIFIIGCVKFTLPNYQLSGTYYNLDYDKDDLINGYFHQTVAQLTRDPYTYQGQYYEETGIAEDSPFMQGPDSGYFSNRMYVN